MTEQTTPNWSSVEWKCTLWKIQM